ncbi:MAG: hypothetical protein R2862_04370 [Thermoanaerobaculia bacterium]
MESLKHWIGTFSGMDGRKSLLLATPGFTANPTAYLSELADSVLGPSIPPVRYEGDRCSRPMSTSTPNSTASSCGRRMRASPSTRWRRAKRRRVRTAPRSAASGRDPPRRRHATRG